MATQEVFWSGINASASSEPKTIMMHQAVELGRITKNIVEAAVRTQLNVDDDSSGFLDNPPTYLHCFDILTPILGYQRFTLFCVKQIVGLDYPLTVFSNYWTENGECTCNDSQEFKDCLKRILSSEKTSGLVNSLIAQSR